jgi:cytochrome c553
MMQPSFLFLALLVLTGSALAASPEGEFQRARQLVAARCALCHGLEGQSVSAEFPRLGGQSPEYFVKQLFLFKTGQRSSNVMQPMADDLSANEIRLLASYFAAQSPPPARADDPELAAVGRYLYFRGNRWSSVSACVSCHGVYASGGAQMPRLAGQHASYIENRLRPRLAGPRGQIDLMHSSIAAMTEFEIKAVAQYLSGED